MTKPHDEFPFKVHDPKTGKLVQAYRTNAEAHAYRKEMAGDGKAEDDQPEPEPEPKADAEPAKADLAKRPDAPKPQPVLLPGMVAGATPVPKINAVPPVPAAGRP